MQTKKRDAYTHTRCHNSLDNMFFKHGPGRSGPRIDGIRGVGHPVGLGAWRATRISFVVL
jgi:hypothetical protein